MSKSSAEKNSTKASWLARTIAGVFGRKKTARSTSKSADSAPPAAPGKFDASHLPVFAGLAPDRILVPHTAEECEAAERDILAAGVAGFDTEAKPTFKAGEKSTGPHVVQFALTDRAYIFQLHRPDCQRVSAELIASERVLKVGFGLRNDHGQIRQRLGVTLHHVLDLDNVFKQRGHKNQIGVRGAIASLLGQNFAKSKSTSTSNWAAPELTPRQLLYAANDAYAALKIMEALDLAPAEIAATASPEKSKQPRPPRRRRRKRATESN